MINYSPTVAIETLPQPVIALASSLGEAVLTLNTGFLNAFTHLKITIG